MKRTKILFLAAIILAVGGAIGYHSYQKNQEPELSKLAIANIEALTEGEGGSGSSSGYQVCSVTRTTTTKKTDEKGFTWEIGVGWLLNGKISNKAPSTYYEVTETLTYKCCMNGGPETSCSYVSC